MSAIGSLPPSIAETSTTGSGVAGPAGEIPMMIRPPPRDALHARDSPGPRPWLRGRGGDLDHRDHRARTVARPPPAPELPLCAEIARRMSFNGDWSDGRVAQPGDGECEAWAIRVV